MIGHVSYSSDRVYRNCHIVRWHPNLIRVSIWLMEVVNEVVITSAFRTRKIHEEDSGIHTTDPLRAKDIRSYIYPKPEALKNRINKIWTYDFDRPEIMVALLHDTGLGMHFHIQVHDNTKAMWEV